MRKIENRKTRNRFIDFPISNFLILVLFGLLGAAVSAFGVKFSGRSSTTFYGFESDSTHYNLYQNFDISALEIGTKAFSIHSYLRFKKDLSLDESVDSKIHSLYLNWRGNFLDVRAGRQFVTAGVGRATNVDGLKLKVYRSRLFSLTTYAGVETPSDSTKVCTWSDGNVMGAYLSFDFIKNSIFGLSWMRKEKAQEVDWQSVVLDADGYMRSIRLYSKLGFDLIEERFDDFLLGAGYEPNRRIFMYTEFLRHTPTFSKSSVFSKLMVDSVTLLKKVEPVSQLRIGSSYSLCYGLDFLDEYSVTLFDTETSHRLWMAIRKGCFTIGYLFSTGYGGNENGIDGSFRFSLSSKLKFDVFTRYSRYRLLNNEGTLNEDIATHFGINYKLAENCGLTVRMENLWNRLYEYNTRILLNTTVKLR